jgi:hypothetical protein
MSYSLSFYANSQFKGGNPSPTKVYILESSLRAGLLAPAPRSLKKPHILASEMTRLELLVSALRIRNIVLYIAA